MARGQKARSRWNKLREPATADDSVLPPGRRGPTRSPYQSRQSTILRDEQPHTLILVPIDISTAISSPSPSSSARSRSSEQGDETIMPMVMKVTHRSSQSAGDSALLHPVGGHEALAGSLFELLRNLSGLVEMSSTLNSSTVIWSPRPSRLCVSRRVNAHELS